MRFFDSSLTLSQKLYSFEEMIIFAKKHTIKQNINAARFFINRNKPLTNIPWNPIYATVVVDSRCNQRCKFCL